MIMNYHYEYIIVPIIGYNMFIIGYNILIKTGNTEFPGKIKCTNIDFR